MSLSNIYMSDAEKYKETILGQLGFTESENNYNQGQSGGYNMSSSNFNDVDASGNNVFHQLAYSGNKSKITSLLRFPGARRALNAQNNNGDTPLHLATKANNAEICDMLVKAGANTNIRNNAGFRVMNEDAVSNVSSPTATEVGRNLDGLLNALSKFKVAETDTVSDMHMTETINTPVNITESGNIKDTEDLLRVLSMSYFDSGKDVQSGGARRHTFNGTRKMNTYTEYGRRSRKNRVRPSVTSSDFSVEYSASNSDSPAGVLSRMFNKQKNEIHHNVVKKIIELLDIDEETAKAYKSYLWKKVKSDHPEMNNLDRSLEMEKLSNKKDLKKIDPDEIEDLKLVIRAHLEEKRKLRESSEASGDMPKKSKKGKKTKKTAKKPKKASKKGKKIRKIKLESSELTTSTEGDFDLNISETSPLAESSEDWSQF
jgi:hypothetical protein